MAKVCRFCGDELIVGKNWTPSARKGYNYICTECMNKKTLLWKRANPDKARTYAIRYKRNNGSLPMGENKECPQYLGIHVAEKVMRHVFNDVDVMPRGNRGYDFVCNHGKLIDVKSSCLDARGGWQFNIRRNTVANYFLCIAFDNRKDLNPLYIWLIPGDKVNHLRGTSICPGTVHKWDHYKLDVDRVSSCCDIMKNNNH